MRSHRPPMAAVTEMEEAEETSKRSGKRKRGGGSSTSKTELQSSSKKKEREDVCFICFESFDGGNKLLLPCDHRGCTKVYHPACVDRDESIIFPCKNRWNCAWHNCSNCDKSAHYMCYMCTYSLCKSCSNEADFLCARENKGFCESCMSIVIQIEKSKQGNKEMVQVGFDDKNSWDYLFKNYWVHLKGRLSLNLDTLTQVGISCKESGGMAHKGDSSKEIYDDNQNCNSNSSSGNIEGSSSGIKKARGQLNCFKESDSASMGKAVSGAGISISNDTEWATKELLEFVGHVKNGDLSVLSLSGVQALLLGYIKQNNLRAPERKYVIVCDSTLHRLFGKKHLKHFEMLSLLKSHFILKSSNEICDANYRQDANSSGSSGNLELSQNEIRNANGKSNSLKGEDLVTLGDDVCDEAVSISNDTEWASKELLEFVAYVKNGDLSVMSLFDVQALLFDYVQVNKLRNPDRKNQIFCDSRLRTLFGKPCVLHFEMVKLTESHFLVNKDIQSAEIHGDIVDIEAGKLDIKSAGDPQTKMVADKKCKTWKKGVERGPWEIFFDYAAICAHNLNLIFLKHTLLEDLLEDNDSFLEKVIGSFVRIKIPGFGQRKDLHRLVRVVGAKRVAEPYKVGKRTTDVMLEVQNLNERETVSIEDISDQEFTEDECVNLRQSIKCGSVCPLRVGEIQVKVMALQAVRVNNCLQKEILQLCHLRDRASEKGHKKEECLKKLKILESPEEHSRRLKDISVVHADPRMDPKYVPEADDELDDKTPDCYMKTRDGGFSMKGRDPISPEKGSSDSHDTWSEENINSITDQEHSRRLKDISVVHADPKMDPKYVPEADDELDDKTLDCYMRTRDGGFSMKGRDPISPEKGSSDSHDTWSEENINSITDQEASRTMSNKEILEGDNDAGESPWSQGRDAQNSRCEQSYNQGPATGSESGASNDQALVTSGLSSGILPETAVTSLPAAEILSSTVNDTKTFHGNEEGRRKHTSRTKYDGELNEKNWHYQDPSGKIQGPYSIVQLRKWCSTGYFPANLRLWRTTENQDQDSILMTDALNGKFLKNSPHNLVNDGVSQAVCLQRIIVSGPSESSSLVSSFVSHSPKDGDNLIPMSGLVSPIVVRVGGDVLLGSQDDPSTSLHSSIPEVDPGRVRNPVSSTDARQSPQSTMIVPHGVSQGDFLDPPNESIVHLPACADVGGGLLPSSKSNSSTSLHSSSSEADRERANNLFNSTDARQIPQFTTTDDTHRVSQGDVFDRPNELGVQLPTGAEMDGQFGSGEVSTTNQTLASSGTLMHTVADPVSDRNSTSNAVSMSVLFGALSVGKHEPQDDNHVLQPCSTQKLEIDSKHGIESLGWGGSVLSQRLEPSSSPVPLPVSQKPEQLDCGHRDDNGPTSFKMSDGSFGMEDQTGYLPSPRFSVSDTVPPCNWSDAAITERAGWSTSSTAPPIVMPSSWSFSHGNNSTILSRTTIKTNQHMQSSVPSTNLDNRILENLNNGWEPIPEDSNTSCLPWGPHQGNTSTQWGVSRQSRGKTLQGYTPSNQGAIHQENNMGCRAASHGNAMSWENHIPCGAAEAVLQGGDNNGWVAASHGNATSGQGTMLHVKNTGWCAPAANIDLRTMPWGNHTPRGAVLQGGDNNGWEAASHVNTTGVQGTRLHANNNGWREPTANIDPRTMPWGNHTPLEAVLQGGDNNGWEAASHVNTNGGQGTMWHVNNNGWRAPVVNIGRVSTHERGNGGRTFGQWGRGSHGGDSGHGGWRASWNRQSRFGGAGRRRFSGPFHERQVCRFYMKGYCKWENNCKFLHPS